MAKIQGKVYRFNASTSPDVVAYLLAYGLRGSTDVDFTDPSVYNTLPSGAVFDAEHNKMAVNLEAIMINEPEGTYDLAIIAVDQAGNESDFGAVVRGVPLDFTPPAPVTGGEVTNS